MSKFMNEFFSYLQYIAAGLAVGTVVGVLGVVLVDFLRTL
jgi:hypothetical protein